MHADDDGGPEGARHLSEESLARNEGVLVQPPHSRIGCSDPEVDCGMDDYAEDPYSVGNRPGTVDDVGYSYGVELPGAADQHFVAEGSTHQRGAVLGEEREFEPGELDERDLWRRQRALIEEDAVSGYRLPEGLEDRAEAVSAALGDDAAELTESGEGLSATGSSPGLDHGGFPHREK